MNIKKSLQKGIFWTITHLEKMGIFLKERLPFIKHTILSEQILTTLWCELIAITLFFISSILYGESPTAYPNVSHQYVIIEKETYDIGNSAFKSGALNEISLNAPIPKKIVPPLDHFYELAEQSNIHKNTQAQEEPNISLQSAQEPLVETLQKSSSIWEIHSTFSWSMLEEKKVIYPPVNVEKSLKIENNIPSIETKVEAIEKPQKQQDIQQADPQTLDEKVLKNPSKQDTPPTLIVKIPIGIDLQKDISIKEMLEATWSVDIKPIDSVIPLIKEISPVNIKKEPTHRGERSEDVLSRQLYREKEEQLDDLGNDIFRNFTHTVLKNDNMFLEKGIWYTYNYPNYKSFWKWVIPSIKDTQVWNLDYDTTVLMLDPSLWAVFVTEPKKVKLVSDDIIVDIAWKREFLRQLVEDKKYLHEDTDAIFIDLKKKTTDLTRGLEQDMRIVKIYDYILSNIAYSFNVAKKENFSGIATYDNKVGACGGYSKLFLYMLSFAWIGDVWVIKWTVLDAQDFPNIAHAWVKIGGLYYDPTFDDPIGQKWTKNFENYKYFWLPKDLFYTNRFDFWTLPISLKTADTTTRKNYIHEQLKEVSEKYKGKNYILLEGIK